MTAIGNNSLFLAKGPMVQSLDIGWVATPLQKNYIVESGLHSKKRWYSGGKPSGLVFNLPLLMSLAPNPQCRYICMGHVFVLP